MVDMLVKQEQRRKLTLGDILEALVGSHDCGLVMGNLDLKASPGT